MAIQVGVASLWPSTAYKVCQTPFICMKWTWYVYEVDRRSQSQPYSVVSSQMWHTARPWQWPYRLGLHPYDHPLHIKHAKHFLYVWSGREIQVRMSVLLCIDAWSELCHWSLLILFWWCTLGNSGGAPLMSRGCIRSRTSRPMSGDHPASHGPRLRTRGGRRVFSCSRGCRGRVRMRRSLGPRWIVGVDSRWVLLVPGGGTIGRVGTCRRRPLRLQWSVPWMFVSLALLCCVCGFLVVPARIRFVAVGCTVWRHPMPRCPACAFYSESCHPHSVYYFLVCCWLWPGPTLKWLRPSLYVYKMSG
jgi:hypothetical protein